MKEMKDWKWQVLLGLSLVLASAALFFIDYEVLRDAHYIFAYFLTGIAFLPIEVLLVTLIIHRLLAWREKKAKLKKLNMMIGMFFTELGTELLRVFSSLDSKVAEIAPELILTQGWLRQEFLKASRNLKGYEGTVQVREEKLSELKNFLSSKKNFLLQLLGNPYLMEHDTFTDLLWAVFHFEDELAHRKDFGRLSPADAGHLAGDIRRAYGFLIIEWLAYMEHLKNHYPYLFSLALRTNPFDRKAKVEVD